MGAVFECMGACELAVCEASKLPTPWGFNTLGVIIQDDYDDEEEMDDENGDGYCMVDDRMQYIFDVNTKIGLSSSCLHHSLNIRCIEKYTCVLCLHKTLCIDGTPNNCQDYNLQMQTFLLAP